MDGPNLILISDLMANYNIFIKI